MKYKIGILLVFVLLLASCAPDTSILETDSEAVLQQASDLLGSSSNDEDENVEDVKDSEEVSSTPTPVEAGEDVEDTADTATPQPMFEMVEVPLIDLGGAWFQPVNPLEVDLSSGEYQILEFSAFW